jgi:hypothetical protein
VEPSRSERILRLASTPGLESKFLSLLHHKFFPFIDQRKIAKAISGQAWEQPALSFSTMKGFGCAEKSLMVAHRVTDMAILVITVDGLYGFYRDEGSVDSEVLIVSEAA